MQPVNDGIAAAETPAEDLPCDYCGAPVGASPDTCTLLSGNRTETRLCAHCGARLRWLLQHLDDYVVAIDRSAHMYLDPLMRILNAVILRRLGTSSKSPFNCLVSIEQNAGIFTDELFAHVDPVGAGGAHRATYRWSEMRNELVLEGF
jgi:hypothetical protein